MKSNFRPEGMEGLIRNFEISPATRWAWEWRMEISDFRFQISELRFENEEFRMKM